MIGAGPAGLMAADVLSGAGHSVVVADAMPSPARKFLMAGKSGLNLTKVGSGFLEAYGDIPEVMRNALEAFGPEAVIEWAEALGQDVFVGSTGRVFPKAMKASPLLRTWLRKLGDQRVELRTRWRWNGWNEQDALSFSTPDAEVSEIADAVVLALGGASWSRLGSDGQWSERFPNEVSPFRPANMGFEVDWSRHMQPFFGVPVKGVALFAGNLSSRGEFVISERGVEGGGIYEVSASVRDGAGLYVDLIPDMDVESLRQRLDKRGKASLSNHLRKALKFDAVKIALLQEFGRPLPTDLAPLLKALQIQHSGPRPLDEAISVAGGLRFDALNADLMLHSRKGVFCAGEMLDWEAPTGGYLINGCLATGRWAALSTLRWLAG